MKALAWYAIIFDAMVILLLVLTAAGIVPPAPFSWFESIAWTVLTLPVIYLGIRVLKNQG